MQQNKTEMQRDRELPEVRCFPFGTDKTDIHNVEGLIIDKYLGIPYVHRGRTLQGLDCWGLLKCIYTDLGCEIFDIETLEYTKTWARSGGDYFKENYCNDWEEVDTPQVLDAVLFNNKRGVANHAGVVLSGGRFIHAPRQGVVVSKLHDDVWKRKLEGIYRLKGRKW